MGENYKAYRSHNYPTPDKSWGWNLYGAGLESLGKDGQMIDIGIPEYGPNELLVRHDACGICFSSFQ